MFGDKELSLDGELETDKQAKGSYTATEDKFGAKGTFEAVRN
jgi:hypothetical protein